MNNARYYITVSSKNHGALAIFHAHAAEPVLARTLDARIGVPPLAPHDLKYGWLRSEIEKPGEPGEMIDEVMLACPASGQRILMTHGGKIIRAQVEAFFERNGFTSVLQDGLNAVCAGTPDPLLDPVLAACITEGQAAAVLAAREAGESPDTAKILMQRRIVLAGAPNAGKSSLMNALAGYDRSFVDPEPGATRDVVDELVDIAGYAVWLGDMPGHMDPEASPGANPLHAEIRQKAAQRLSLSNEIWFTVDASEEWSAAAESAAAAVAEILHRAGEREAEKPVLVLLNKTDLPRRLAGTPWKKHFPDAPAASLTTLPGGNALEALERHASETWL